MTLTQVLEQLTAFTVEEKQLLIRRVIELDDPLLSDSDERLAESRLAAHYLDPSSSVPLETLREHLKSRRKQ
jgi:hypothetical protein